MPPISQAHSRSHPTRYRLCATSWDISGFEADVLLQDGIIRNIGVIGEAAIKIKRVAPQLVTEWPSIPWHDMQTMRHKLVHDYFDVDLSVVWTTVQHDLPQLAAQIKELLETLSPGGQAPMAPIG